MERIYKTVVGIEELRASVLMLTSVKNVGTS